MYQAFSPKQMKVMTWWAHPGINKRYEAIICDGSIRSGKTLSMSTSFLVWAMARFDGCSFAICGKTVSSCRRNVITPLLAEMSSEMDCRELISRNYLEVSYQGRTNRFYIFGGKDESSAALIQGVTLAGVLFDEVALMPRSFVEQALARCSVEGSKFWFNCNPEGPLHWFYTEWIQKAKKKRALYLHFTMDDNPTLSREVRHRYETLFTGVFYDRFVRGCWVKAEGLVYPMFGPSMQTEEQPEGRYYVSVDYGTLNPFSAGLWSIAGGVGYRIAEYYHDGRSTGTLKTDEEYYSDLCGLIGDRRIEYIIIDPSAASFIECIRRHGRFRVRRAINDVLPGIRVTASLLSEGRVKIHTRCEAAIQEFGLYGWDEKAPTDRVLKEHDHAMDEIRYFCMTVLRRERR